ncbi:MAG: hypothetical protein OSJ74_02705 [Clostridia bacterium]|nr:hypothetical protein [Clostridia bacterium]
MQNEQQAFTRPKTPKLKNDWVTVIIKILLYAGIFFSLVNYGKRNFNSLFVAVLDPAYTDILGISLAGYTASMGSSMLVAMKILLPAIMALLFFLFYFAFAKFFATLVFVQFSALKVQFDIRKFRICLDISMILLTVLLGVSETVFTYYPLAYNFGSVIVSPLLALIAMAMFFLLYSRGLEKKYYPVLLNIMLLPTIVLVLFA